MLAAWFFPTSDCRKSPHVCHLFTIIDCLHKLVIILMRHLWALIRPNNELCRVSKESAWYIWWWISLCLRYYVEYLITEFCQNISDWKYIMVVPEIQMASLSLSFSRHNDSHFWLNSMMDSGEALLSQSPLSTQTAFPAWWLISLIVREWGGLRRSY